MWFGDILSTFYTALFTTNAMFIGKIQCPNDSCEVSFRCMKITCLFTFYYWLLLHWYSLSNPSYPFSPVIVISFTKIFSLKWISHSLLLHVSNNASLELLSMGALPVHVFWLLTYCPVQRLLRVGYCKIIRLPVLLSVFRGFLKDISGNLVPTKTAYNMHQRN